MVFDLKGHYSCIVQYLHVMLSQWITEIQRQCIQARNLFSKLIAICKLHQSPLVKKELTMEDEMWKYSTVIDPQTVKQTGCFTTLPVRINNRDDIANGASSRVLKDWAEHTGKQDIDPNRVSFSPVGSFCSLIYCETIPERLDSISYLTDLFFLIDGSFHPKLVCRQV